MRLLCGIVVALMINPASAGPNQWSDILTGTNLETSKRIYLFKEKAPMLLDEWIGQSTDELINVWGYPSNERMSLGRFLVEYYISKGVITQPGFGGLGGNDAKLSQERFCRVLFEIKDNQIVKWQYAGQQKWRKQNIKTCKNLINKEHRPSNLRDTPLPWKKGA